MCRMGCRYDLLLTFRGALWAGVTNRLEDVTDFCNSVMRTNAVRRILTSKGQGAVSSMRVSTVLHPAVLLALANSAGFVQHRKRPSAKRSDRPTSNHHQHRRSILPEWKLVMPDTSADARQ